MCVCVEREREREREVMRQKSTRIASHAVLVLPHVVTGHAGFLHTSCFVSEENKTKLARSKLVETIVVQIVLKIAISLAKLELLEECAVLHQIECVENIEFVLYDYRCGGLAVVSSLS